MTANKVNSDLFLAQAEIADPGNAGTLAVFKSLVVCNLVSVGAETRTLPLPTRAGVVVTIYARTVGGTITLTVTGGLDLNGTTTFAFTAVNQYLVLESFRKADGTFIWLKVSDYGLGNVTPAVAGGANVVGVAAGYKIARGTTALDGSNPTPVTTGLTTVVAAVVTLEGNAAPGLNTTTLTIDPANYATGALSVYAWKPTSVSNPTLIASTGTENFEWVAIGT